MNTASLHRLPFGRARVWMLVCGLLVGGLSVAAADPDNEQRATRREHWAFESPRRADIPDVREPAWSRAPIDHFVLARLDQEGLSPSPQARKETLLRRVTLDLTGLPPTPEEVEAFLNDPSADAYERVVDRLLASPRFGERIAWVWLDAARYADTSGYQSDGPRSMWRWRDWVIEAFNRDLPFDRFTIEQLAGDLVPQATLDQQIATAFNRNHRGNAEGGIVPEEYQVEYVVDRVDTTATVWLGLTIGCARCHDHKYDPVSQKEFYRLFAYFNNVPEYGRALKEGNSPPYILAPTAEQRQRLADLEDRIREAERNVRQLADRIDSEQAHWEEAFERTDGEVNWQPGRSLVACYPLDGQTSIEGGAAAESHPQPGGERGAERRDGSEFLDGPAAFGPGQLGGAARFDGSRFMDGGDVGRFGYFDRFSFAARVNLDGNQGGTVLSRMTDEAEGKGWYLQIFDGRVQVNLVVRWLDDSIRVETGPILAPDQWHHLLVTYDGSRTADGITLFVDGRPIETTIRHDFLNQTFAIEEPLRIGGGGGPEGRFYGRIDDVRIYDDVLSDDEAAALAEVETISSILACSPVRRTAPQAIKLRQYFLERHASEPIRNALEMLRSLRHERRQLVERMPTVMVMKEMPVPRETHILVRGQYDAPSERVAPGVPAVLPPLPAGAPENRLGLAYWLVDRSNPLTARVTVNRIWQLLFGTALVKTVEDFGTQGERPSHPQLLDWLAVDFAERGWSVKRLFRTITTSSIYRQSSRTREEVRIRDPENRLLARGPRFRLSAAMIRDQALAVSGLLTERLGGPSAKPYQPEGLWKEIATDTEYNQSRGAQLYRRSLYTYWKRTVTAPNMMVFDASSREACTVRQTRTNTPLQALALMNDVTFVEAARVFAERVLSAPHADHAERLGAAFELATARLPTPSEQQILTASLEHYLAVYGVDREAAMQLSSIGESPRNENLDRTELAAYTAVCSMILNLDETVTKE